MKLTVGDKESGFSCFYKSGPLLNMQGGDQNVEDMLRFSGVTFESGLFQGLTYPGDFLKAEYLIMDSRLVGIRAIHHAARILEIVMGFELAVNYCQCPLFALQADLGGKVGYFVFPDEKEGNVLTIYREHKVLDISRQRADRVWPPGTTFVYFRKP